MKTSRRGGLGRGLGALIQSTVEVPDENAETSSPKDSPVPAKSGQKAAAAAATTTTSTQSTATTETSGDSTEPDPSALPRNTTGRTAQTGKSTSTTGRNTTSATKAGATSSKRASRPAQRPVDVFFSADSEDAPAARSTKGRPAMPTVKAPSKRATSAASSRKEPVDSTAESVTPKGTVSTDIAVLREIPVGDIHPNPRQPREVFDEDHMAELVTSIREVGILQPIVVREVDGPTPYELIMGERRWRATQKAGLDIIPAIVRQTPDQDLLRLSLIHI